MSENTKDKGNSLGDTPVIEPKSEQEIQNDSDVNNFFDSLDKEVNDVAYEVTTSEQATQQPQSDSVESTRLEAQTGSDDNTEWEQDSNPYKKRYTDSSKEAVRLKEQYQEVEPFVPVLEAMKNDSGLVDHVRDYLENGGTPAKTIQDQLKLDEDFIYDANEAVSEPDSDSAKVMNAHVDSIVKQRIDSVLQNEKKVAEENKQTMMKKQSELEFREKHQMSEENFDAMVSRAKDHTLTLDDIHYVLNRDRNDANVRNSTQKEMLTQMKNVRNMPTSNSDANNMSETKDTEEKLFDSIFGDTSTEQSLFG